MSAKGMLGGGIAFVAIVVAIIYSYSRHKTPPTPMVSTPTASITTKATVLRFDGFTRCEPRIDFEFELDTQGDPISLKFPGVDMPLEYSGKGTINAPTNRLSGPVVITSLDSRKQARVIIREVVYLPNRR